jgi:hypothetical protein
LTGVVIALVIIFLLLMTGLALGLLLRSFFWPALALSLDFVSFLVFGFFCASGSLGLGVEPPFTSGDLGFSLVALSLELFSSSSLLDLSSSEWLSLGRVLLDLPFVLFLPSVLGL